MLWHRQVKQDHPREEVMNSKNLKRGLVAIVIAMLCVSGLATAGGISIKCAYAPICSN